MNLLDRLREMPGLARCVEEADDPDSLLNYAFAASEITQKHWQAIVEVVEEAKWLRELQETEWFTLENFPKKAWPTEGVKEWGFMMWTWFGREEAHNIIQASKVRLDNALAKLGVK